MAGGMGIFALPSYINSSGIDRGFYGIVISMVVGLVLSFIMMFILYKEEK